MMTTITSRWPLPSDLTSGLWRINLSTLLPRHEPIVAGAVPGRIFLRFSPPRRCILNNHLFASNFAFASLAWTHRGKLKISQPSQSHVALSPANMVTRRRVFRLAPPVTLTLIIMYSHALHTCTIEQEDINIDILVTCDVT